MLPHNEINVMSVINNIVVSAIHSLQARDHI